MKLGIVLSIVIVVVIGSIVFFLARGVPDGATSATAGGKLGIIDTPTNTNPFGIQFEPTGRANPRYQTLFRYFRQHQRDLNQEEPDPAKADRLIELFIQASTAPDVVEPFLDSDLPMEAGAGTSSMTDAMDLAPQVALIRAHELWESGKKDQAVAAAEAVWIFGQRAFTRSVRFTNRYNGMSTMINTIQTLSAWDPALMDPVTDWIDPLNRIRNAWHEKISVIRSLPPKIGDLVNIAQNDQDMTFRVEATVWLAVAKWQPRTKANKRVILETIERAKQDASPLLQAAAAYADALTVEELRRIR